MILASRGVQFQEVLVPSPVRAPLEAVVEEAEVSGAALQRWWWFYPVILWVAMGGAEQDADRWCRYVQMILNFLL